MSVLTEIAHNQNRYVYLLEIDGLEDTFYSSPKAPELPNYGAPYITSVNIWSKLAKGGIVPGSVSPSSEKIDLTGTVASVGTVAVSVGITRDNNIEQVLRVGIAGDVDVLTLAVTLEQVGALFVEVNEIPNAWPPSGQLWIGRECINYSARSLVAPFQFTITDRGWWGSEVRRIVADPVRGISPRVYSKCSTWQHRRARILVSSLRADGSVSRGDKVTTESGWVELISGRLASDPELSNDNQTVAFNIKSHLAALDISVGGGVNQIGLQEGYHHFDGNAADEFHIRLGFLPGGAFDEVNTVAALPAGTVLTLPWLSHSFTFDPAAASPDAQGRLLIDSEPDTSFRLIDPGGGFYQGPATDGTGTIFVDPPFAVNVPVGTRVKNAETWEDLFVSVLTTPGVEEILTWPEEALSVITNGLSPGSFQDGLVPGQFADVGIAPGTDVVRINTLSRYKTAMTAIFTTYNQNANWLSYGIATYDPDTPTPTAHGSELGLPGNAPVTFRTVTLDLSGVGDAPERQWTSRAAYNIPIRGVRPAWHQQGESTVYVDQDLFSMPAQLQATWTDYDGSTHSTNFEAFNVRAASTVRVGAPGFLLDLTADSIFRRPISFGNTRDGDPCVISEAVFWRDVETPVMFLDLLFSSDGQGFNSSTFDRFTGGAGLTSDAINTESFLAFPAPPGIGSRISFGLGDFDAKTISEVMDPYLKMMGAAIVPQLQHTSDNGGGGVLRRKLTLVSMSAEFVGESRGAINDGTWVGRQRPTGRVDKRLTSSILFKLNYNSLEQEFKLDVIVNDLETIVETGQADTEEIELPGVELNEASPTDQYLALLPLAAQRFAMLGAARKTIEGFISYAASVLLSVGSVVTVSGVDIYGYDGIRGVTSLPMRIVSMTPNSVKQMTKLKLTWHNSSPSGWAPTLKVLAVVGGGVYDVEANAYTSNVNAITSETQVDTDFWATGDSARACPRADFGNSSAGLVLTVVSPTRVSLAPAPAPALGPGDTIVMGDYTAVATTVVQKAFSHYADDAGTLGATPDKGKVYA